MTEPESANAPKWLRGAVNLASPKLGTKIAAVTDEFFAPAERMLQDEPAIFKPGVFDDHGKWMDGWESRRRRDAGHDWAVIRLGVPGEIIGVDFDTSHFTGNYPRAASLEACYGDIGRDNQMPDEDADWRPLVSAQTLGPSRSHFFDAEPLGPVRWLRLRIFPDGGIARLRVYGAPYRAWATANPLDTHELSALSNGGRIVAFSDAHYGNVWSLLTEGRGENMGDGWETRRRREPGNDWIIVELGHPGLVTELEIDTAHFKGNFPHRASVEAALVERGTDESVVTQSLYWRTLLEPQLMEADHIHRFEASSLADLGTITHLKLNIFPDGGVSRFRAFGALAKSRRVNREDAG